MKVMMRIIFYGFIIIIALLSRGILVDVITEQFRFEGEIAPPASNQYALPRNASNFTNKYYTDDFWAKSYEDLRKIVFMIVNSGVRNFTFYCSTEYEDCFVDLERITQDRRSLTYINNFVHPYNAYHHLNIEYDSQRRVVVTISRLYSSRDITDINAAMNKIWSSVVKPEMSTREKLKAIHDQILNNSNYDRDRANAILNNEEKYYDTTNLSHKANGPLIEGMAICGGYSDAMSLFLYRMGLPNYRVSNDQHIWNLVQIDGRWLHLDLTWNNPTTNDDKSVIITTYFLINSKQLENIGDGAHNYDNSIFIEAK